MGLSPEATGRAVQEYLAVLDDAAFGAATEVTPKFISPADPAARWTGAHGGQAFFAHSTNYLIDVDNAIIVDVEATTAIRQAEVLAAKRMIERSMQRFDRYLARLIGDSAYGSAEMLGWLVNEHGIEPHLTVFDKSARVRSMERSQGPIAIPRRSRARSSAAVEMSGPPRISRSVALHRVRPRGWSAAPFARTQSASTLQSTPERETKCQVHKKLNTAPGPLARRSIAKIN